MGDLEMSMYQMAVNWTAESLCYIRGVILTEWGSSEYMRRLTVYEGEILWFIYMREYCDWLGSSGD